MKHYLVETQDNNNDSPAEEKNPRENDEQVGEEILENIGLKLTKAEAKTIEADGGVDLREMDTLLAMGGMKPSNTIVEAFNELDTNKNGKLEESELNSNIEGEDYGILDALMKPVKSLIDKVLRRGTILTV